MAKEKRLVYVSVTVYERDGKEECGQYWLSNTRPQTIIKTAKIAEKMGINRIAGDPALNRFLISAKCALCKAGSFLPHSIPR